MFDGEIICKSIEGQGASFIFVVALGDEETSSSLDESTSGRI